MVLSTSAFMNGKRRMPDMITILGNVVVNGDSEALIDRYPDSHHIAVHEEGNDIIIEFLDAF